jgi:hypothetical protein
MPSYKNSGPVPPIMQGSPPPPEMRVPFGDWDRAPWNRWTFQHVSEMVPTARIRRGDKVSALPAAQGSFDALAYRGVDGQETTFGQMLDDTYTDGILVWKNGKILHAIGVEIGDLGHRGLSDRGGASGPGRADHPLSAGTCRDGLERCQLAACA